MTHVTIPVLLTPIDSNNQMLVPTLHRNDHMVDAKSIEPAAFPFDFSGRSSVRSGMVCASIKTGRKKRRRAAKKRVNM
jgi:hypothetical protein